MNSHWMRGWMMGGALIATAGCVNIGLLGVPLGPQVADGINVEGVAAPAMGTCTFPNPATVFLAYGQMDMGLDNTAVNEYEAILQTTNLRESNACPNSPTVQPSYAGKYGCVDSNDITVVASNIRYEYPTLSLIARFSNQQAPADGFLFQNQTTATGNIPSGSQAQIVVKLINREMARQLAADEDFQKRMASDGSVPIVARVRLEGRTSSGARATSNEFTYRVEAYPPGTWDNCAALNCTAPQVRKPGLQCFPGQDGLDCVCQ